MKDYGSDNHKIKFMQL